MSFKISWRLWTFELPSRRKDLIELYYTAWSWYTLFYQSQWLLQKFCKFLSESFESVLWISLPSYNLGRHWFLRWSVWFWYRLSWNSRNISESESLHLQIADTFTFLKDFTLPLIVLNLKLDVEEYFSDYLLRKIDKDFTKSHPKKYSKKMKFSSGFMTSFKLSFISKISTFNFIFSPLEKLIDVKTPSPSLSSKESFPSKDWPLLIQTSIVYWTHIHPSSKNYKTRISLKSLSHAIT